MKNKTRILAIILLVFCFTAFLINSFQKEMKREKLPVLGKVLPFTLTDIDNQGFDSSKLNGKVWIASFLFTTCSDVCPVMAKNLASLNRSFELEPGIKIVSISVNPEFDTPQRLKEFGERYKAKTSQWYFLTGSRDKIRDVVIHSFKLGSIEEPIFHSSYFALVDRHGYIRAYFDGTDQGEVNKLFKAAGQLVKQR